MGLSERRRIVASMVARGTLPPFPLGFFLGLFCAVLGPEAGRAESISDERPVRSSQSFEFCPVSPLFKIYAIHYCRRVTPKNERRTYPTGFDLWNEFRLAYIWAFRLLGAPAFVNVQWPLGFILHSDPDGMPRSFKEYQKDRHYFWYPPLFFVGVRF